jgi:hypothetical protein
MWSKEELRTLRKLYSTVLKEELEKMLPKRKWDGIMSKARQLGLSRDPGIFCHGKKRKKVIDLGVIDTEEKAYILGFAAADGCLTCPKRNGRSCVFCIVLSHKDYDHVVKLRDIVSPRSTIYTATRTTLFKSTGKTYSGDVSGFSVADKDLANNLIKHGIVPRKTRILEIPKTVPPHLFHHWVRGYFDGDGTVYNNHLGNLLCGLSGYGKDDDIKNPVLYFINEEFNKIFPNTCNVIKKSRGNIAELSYSGRTALAFLHWIYKDATLFLTRKYNIASDYFINDISEIPITWSREDRDFIIQNYTEMTATEIGNILGKTEGCVRSEIFNLRKNGWLEFYKDKAWTDGEIEFLVNNCTEKTYRELGVEIGRGWDAVRHKLNELGLKSKSKRVSNG